MKNTKQSESPGSFRTASSTLVANLVQELGKADTNGYAVSFHGDSASFHGN